MISQKKKKNPIQKQNIVEAFQNKDGRNSLKKKTKLFVR